MHCSDGRIEADMKFWFGGLVGGVTATGPEELFERPWMIKNAMVTKSLSKT